MDLPEGVVTFLFSDVEGSTQLLERHPREMGGALARHYELFETVVADHDGVIFETVGDAVYAAFRRPEEGVGAALAAQRALAAEDWGPVGRIACRIAVHTGEVERRGDHYFGPALFRCARLQVIGYGEQTLVSGHTAGAVRDRLPDRATLRDLGRHRLKDLSEPEQVFMLVHPDLRSDFPPPKSIDLRPNNLPLQLSSFVGRQAEAQAVAELLAEHRLVNLIGVGGVGKTRLALQIAAEAITTFPDGAFVVDLAAVRDAEQVNAAIAATLGLPGAGGAFPEALHAFLEPRHMLLVLDNLEQIRAAGQPVLDLLRGAPHLRVLATSRKPLRVRGEHAHRVQPLSPEGDGVDPGPAVQLFLDRAVAAGAFALTDDNASTVVEICRRLDGLPLAIELAAARTTLFEPAELLARLGNRLGVLTGGAEDLPERQRTLRATIAWSVGLLDPETQRAFARLGVFHGGWRLEAAEQVCGADLEVHGRLVDLGLIRRAGNERFNMLETVREFAVDQLHGSGDEPEASARHAMWYADWLERLPGASPLRHYYRREEFQVLHTERENLARTMDQLIASENGPTARNVATRLWMYWLDTGYLDRGEAWLRAATELPPPVDGAEAAALAGITGEFPRFAGEPERAIPLKERSLELARAAADEGLQAMVLADLTYLWLSLGGLDRARSSAESALLLRRRIGSPGGIGHALLALGEVEARSGELDRATEAYEEAARYDGEDEPPFALLGLAEVHRLRGDLSRAATCLRSVTGWCMEGPYSSMSVEVFEYAAALFSDADDAAAAAIALGAQERLRRESGIGVLEPALHEQTVAAVEAALAPADLRAARERGARLSEREALQFVLKSPVLERLTG